MKKKLISIIINCHNGEKYLHKTLESILDQKYKNYEVIFVDNLSKDSSAEIFKKIQDKRFKYFKTKKKLDCMKEEILHSKNVRVNLLLF